MEVSGRGQTNSEDFDTGISCDPCLIDNVNEHAQFYCTNCDEFLCDTCTRNHKRNKASRQHDLLDRDEMPKQKISNVQDKFCAKHDGKLIEYLCNKHNTFSCSVCVTLYHVQCGVRYIDDLATDFSTSEEYKSLLKQIKDIEQQLTENKNKTQHDSDDVITFFRQIQVDIQEFRSEINSKLDTLEQELLQQAEQIKKEDLEAIESVDTLNSKLLEDLSEISSTLGLLEKCKQNQQLFISSKKSQTHVKEYNDKARKMLQENIVRRYALVRNKNILNALDSPSKLGLFEIQNKRDGRTKQIEQTAVGIMKEDNPSIVKLGIRKAEERREEQKTQHGQKTMTTDTIKPTQFKFMKNIKLKHKTDTEGLWITGSVLMSNDRLAVADRDNYSINVIDLRSDTITCNIKLDNKPWDITCMDQGTLVVTCDTNLVFLRYNGKLSVVKKVPMELGCSGITYSRNRLFVTFDGKHPSVKILNNEGKVLQTFQHNDKGENLFSNPGYITVNHDGDTMYVSDYGQNTVNSLSMDGKVCHIYKDDSLSGPKGLTVGNDDCIYVAGWWSHNIHQLTPSCTHVRIVGEKDGLGYPRTVLYNNTNKSLYVGIDSLDGILRVYKLE